MWNSLLVCQYTLSAPAGKKFPKKVWDLDLSYMSLQINVDPFTSKMAFLPAVFLGLEFNEAFELHLVPFK